MKLPTHTSAKPSHYNKEAEHYDKFNETNSIAINQLIAKLLKKYRVKSVLDLTCGTGSQVFWLAKLGYEVVGSDINRKMLKQAKLKAKKENRNIKFIKGDMRETQAGQFDAVITIFNAVGHLTKSDFIKAMKNVHKNLNDNGVYIFDIVNLNYFLENDNITKLTIDWQKKVKNKTVREIQYSTINKEGILASYDIYHEQIGNAAPKITKAFQTLQIYSAEQLQAMLQKTGFEVLQYCGIDGLRFNDKKSERIFIIARRN